MKTQNHKKTGRPRTVTGTPSATTLYLTDKDRTALLTLGNGSMSNGCRQLITTLTALNKNLTNNVPKPNNHHP